MDIMPPQPDEAGKASPVSIINMLRTTQQNHMALSSLADQKASFLIGASVVTLSIVLGHWTKSQPSLPLATLGIGSLLSSTFAALSLMPRSQPPQGSGLSFNPLFFAHFTEMAEAEYLQTMKRIIKEDHTIYEAMMRDIHQLGLVLRKKKFFYLGWGYRCFVMTLLATFITACIEFLT